MIVFVDTQYDFLNPNGKLYVPEASKIMVNLHALYGYAILNGETILTTSDRHSVNDPEFKIFPEHCLKYSSGANNYFEVDGNINLHKQTYNVWDKKDGDVFIHKLKYAFEAEERIIVSGIATDICVKAFIDGLIEKEWVENKQIYLVNDATAGLDKTEETIKHFYDIGVNVRKTREILC
jgi:nicotinamidase/pyrazinamidase